jgi:hypothetical protein
VDKLLAIAGRLDIQGGEPPNKLPRFEMLASTGSPMRLSGWRHPVVVDLEGMRIPRQTLPIRYNHDQTQGVGHTDQIRIERYELRASGVISRDTPASRDVLTAARNGFPWQASIGASADKVEHVPEGKTGKANGKDWLGPVDIARLSTLGEISFVDVGADLATYAFVAGRGDTMYTDTDADPIQEERSRIRAIRDVCRGDHRDIEAKAIEEGWSIAETKSHVLDAIRAGRSSGRGMIQGVTGGFNPRDMLTASCMLMGGHGESIVKALKNGEQLANSIERPSGFPELCAMALRLQGRDVPTGRNELIQAAFSTTDLTVALGTSIEKVHLEVFLELSQNWIAISRIVPAQTFRPGKAIRLEGNTALEKLDGRMELKSSVIGEDAFDYKIDTYGRIFGISRQDIINDDAGLLTDLPILLGSEAARSVSDLWASVLIGAESAGFFSSTNKNLLTSSPLGIPSVADAVASLRSQRDLSGRVLGLIPVVLLVPANLEFIGYQVLLSAELSRVLTGDQLPKGNPLTQYNIINRVEARLDADSTTSWYLFSLPRYGAILVATLMGQLGCRVEQIDQPGEFLGIRWRAFMDFGVSLGEFRAAVKGTA